MSTNQEKPPIEQQVDAYFAHYLASLAEIAGPDAVYHSIHATTNGRGIKFTAAAQQAEDFPMIVSKEYDHPLKAIEEIKTHLGRRAA